MLFRVCFVLLLFCIVYWLKHSLNKTTTNITTTSATVKISNQTSSSTKQCTGSSLVVCNTNDPDQCMSCSNPFATCIHFSKDSKFVDARGKEFHIPKNAHSSQGYCLPVKLPDKPCNVFHGDLLVVHSERSKHTEAELVCRCKNPGFIGGSECQTPFICGGKVKNINVPFSQLDCVCPVGSTFRRQNGIPTCVESTLQDNDPAGIRRLEQQLSQPADRQVLSAETFLDNDLPYKQITNPCSICPITGQPVKGYVENTHRGGGNYECISTGGNSWFGVPVRLHKSSRLLRGKTGPDAILAITFKSVFMYGKLSEDERTMYVIVFDYENGKNAKIYEALQLDKHKEYFIRSTGHEFVWPGSFRMWGYLFQTIPFFECYPGAVTYKCTFTPSHRITDGPNDGLLLREAPSGSYYAAQYKPVAKPPFYFGWGLADWEETATFEKPFEFEYAKGRDGLTQWVEPAVYRSVTSEISRRLKYLYAAVHRDDKVLRFYLASETDAANNWKTYLNHLYKYTPCNE